MPKLLRFYYNEFVQNKFDLHVPKNKHNKMLSSTEH